MRVPSPFSLGLPSLTIWIISAFVAIKGWLPFCLFAMRRQFGGAHYSYVMPLQAADHLPLNHASNLALAGNMPKDKEKLLLQLREAMAEHCPLRP